MSEQELRDELMTALVAGHETTASQLGWALERLSREPRVQARLGAEIEAEESDEYLTATINEILRLRPVLPNAEPRLTKRAVTIGGRLTRPGWCCWPAPTWSITTPICTRSRPRSGLSASSAARPAPTPGSLRGRAATLPGGELCHRGDEDRPAYRAAQLRPVSWRRAARDHAPAQHHLQPVTLSDSGPAPAGGSRRRPRPFCWPARKHPARARRAGGVEPGNGFHAPRAGF